MPACAALPALEADFPACAKTARPLERRRRTLLVLLLLDLKKRKWVGLLLILSAMLTAARASLPWPPSQAPAGARPGEEIAALAAETWWLPRRIMGNKPPRNPARRSDDFARFRSDSGDFPERGGSRDSGMAYIVGAGASGADGLAAALDAMVLTGGHTIAGVLRPEDSRSSAYPANLPQSGTDGMERSVAVFETASLTAGNSIAPVSSGRPGIGKESFPARGKDSKGEREAPSASSLPSKTAVLDPAGIRPAALGWASPHSGPMDQMAAIAASGETANAVLGQLILARALAMAASPPNGGGSAESASSLVRSSFDGAKKEGGPVLISPALGEAVSIGTGANQTASITNQARDLIDADSQCREGRQLYAGLKSRLLADFSEIRKQLLARDCWATHSEYLATPQCIALQARFFKDCHAYNAIASQQWSQCPFMAGTFELIPCPDDGPSPTSPAGGQTTAPAAGGTAPYGLEIPEAGAGRMVPTTGTQAP